jgi:hypothetical protein
LDLWHHARGFGLFEHARGQFSNEEKGFNNLIARSASSGRQVGRTKHSRPAVIEQALRRFLGQRARAGTELRDLELINDAADRLNTESAEVLDYA